MKVYQISVGRAELVASLMAFMGFYTSDRLRSIWPVSHGWSVLFQSFRDVQAITVIKMVFM